MSDRCKSCGADVLFARHERTGKWMPFQLDESAGEWIIVDGSASHQGKAPEHWGSVPRYTSHFATCPQAGRWRRAK